MNTRLDPAARGIAGSEMTPAERAAASSWGFTAGFDAPDTRENIRNVLYSNAPQDATAQKPDQPPAPQAAAAPTAPAAEASDATGAPMLNAPPPPGPGWEVTGPGGLNANLGKQIPRESMQALASLGGKGAY